MKQVPHPYRTITATITVPNEYAQSCIVAIGAIMASFHYPFTIGDVPDQGPETEEEKELRKKLQFESIMEAGGGS